MGLFQKPDLFRKRLLQAMAVTAFAATAFVMAGTRAEATTLNFVLSGDYNTSWTLDSNPTPTNTDPVNDSTFFLGVPSIDPLYLMFFGTTTGSGGIRASTGTDITTEVGAVFDLAGPQIFSGSLDAPVFAPGLYSFSQDFVTNLPFLSTTTLKISAVATAPIPAALPLFLTGLLGLGLARWWRRNAG